MNQFQVEADAGSQAGPAQVLDHTQPQDLQEESVTAQSLDVHPMNELDQPFSTNDPRRFDLDQLMNKLRLGEDWSDQQASTSYTSYVDTEPRSEILNHTPGRETPPARPETPPARPETPPARPETPPARPETPPLNPSYAFNSEQFNGRPNQLSEEMNQPHVGADGNQAAPAQVLANKLPPETLQAELDKAQSLGIEPMHVDDQRLEDFANAGLIKWAVTPSGELLVVPHTVREEEIAHSVLTNGGPVLAAGVADIAIDIDVDYHDIEGFSISNQSSDYPIDPKSLEIGIQAFQDRYGITFEYAEDFSDHVDENGQNVDSHSGNGENKGKEDQEQNVAGGDDGKNGDTPPVSDGDGSGSDTESDAESEQELQTIFTKNYVTGATSEAKAQNNTDVTNTADLGDLRNNIEDSLHGQSPHPFQTEQSSSEEKIAAFLKNYEGRNPSEPITLAEMKEQWAEHPEKRNEGNGTKEARNSVLDPTNSSFDPHPPAPEGYHWTLDKDQLRLDRNEANDNIEQLEYTYNRENNNDENLKIGIFIDKKDDKVDIPADKKLIQEIRIDDLPAEQLKYSQEIMDKREEYRHTKDALEPLKKDGTLSEADAAKLKEAWDGLTTQSRLLGEKAADYYASYEYIDEHGSRQTLERVFPLEEDHPSRSGEFDQIWKVEGTDKYVIIEAKGGSSPLGTRDVDIRGDIQKAQQGTREYFDDIVKVMENTDNPYIVDLANQLQAAMDNGSVDYLVVRQEINTKGEEHTLGNIIVSRFTI
jgi:hypothetical protein